MFFFSLLALTNRAPNNATLGESNTPSAAAAAAAANDDDTAHFSVIADQEITSKYMKALNFATSL
ncbi:unnamed protein product [Ceratitis capitata]|uniref:(Mediterranean fruit fly) hypothetical protein n=1 Tax=Ceratitis capitata TaxID=7213 RepID=A0A811UY64_CERCA|nr:unnamed protein product [Ceratitis capitata]